jgi:adenylate cyclase
MEVTQAVPRRKLAAILSADVAGYSRLMEYDEHATVDALNEYRRITRKHIIERF